MLSFVSEEINQYCQDQSTLPSPLAAELEAFTQANIEFPQMLTGPLVGSFLGFLINSLKAKRILEVGTFTGYSALCMAEQLPGDGELITLDINEKNVSVGRSYWARSPQGGKIKALIGPAIDSMKTLRPGFDFVFIDADKSNYLNYLKAALPLLSSKGIVVADNCLWSGRVLESGTTDPDTKALQEFNRFVSTHPNLRSVLLPVRDGLHLIQPRDLNR